MIKNILGIIAGYAIFVASSLALFKASGVDPHGDSSVLFQIITAVYGGGFSFFSGFVVQLISKKQNILLNYALAIFIAGFATFSLFRTAGSHWTQLLAIVVFAPVSIFGGIFYIGNNSKPI